MAAILWLLQASAAWSTQMAALSTLAAMVSWASWGTKLLVNGNITQSYSQSLPMMLTGDQRKWCETWLRDVIVPTKLSAPSEQLLQQCFAVIHELDALEQQMQAHDRAYAQQSSLINMVCSAPDHSKTIAKMHALDNQLRSDLDIFCKYVQLERIMRQ